MYRKLLLGLILVSHFVNAQWTGDPASPLTICDAPFNQDRTRAVPDGGDGWFLLWRDGRNGNTEIWGQQIDLDGYAQWEPNGRQLVALPGRHIGHMEVAALSDGGFMLAYTTAATAGNGDTVRVARMDAQGASVWPTHALVGGRTVDAPSNYACLGLRMACHPDGNAFVTWTHTPLNVSVCSVNRVTADGNAPWGFNGYNAPTSGGDKAIAVDGDGGAFMLWKTAATSRLRTNRIRADGTWAFSETVLLPPEPGTQVSEYEMIADGDKGAVVSWRMFDSTNDLYMTSLDSTGAPKWSTAVKPICQAPGTQSEYRFQRYEDHLFAVWRDGRTGAQGIYAQKFDLDGDPLWTTDGVELIGTDGSTTTPNMAPMPDGGVMVTVSQFGYRGYRVAPDGNMAWSAHVQVAISATQLDRIVLATPENGAVSFWQHSANVFGARILPTGELAGAVGIHEHGRAPSLSAWPVPTLNVLYIRQPTTHSEVAITVYTMDGRMVQLPFTRVGDDVLQLDLTTLSSGVYVAQVMVDRERYHARFVKE